MSDERIFTFIYVNARCSCSHTSITHVAFPLLAQKYCISIALACQKCGDFVIMLRRYEQLDDFLLAALSHHKNKVYIH